MSAGPVVRQVLLGPIVGVAAHTVTSVVAATSSTAPDSESVAYKRRLRRKTRRLNANRLGPEFMIDGADVGEPVTLSGPFGAASITLDAAQILALNQYGGSAVYTSDSADSREAQAHSPRVKWSRTRPLPWPRRRPRSSTASP